MRRRLFFAGVVVTAIAGISLPLTAGGAAAKTPRRAANPWGIKIVRFAPGTTPTQMRAAVQQSGGFVVTDLSQIRALAVGSKNTDFVKKLRSTSSVRSVFTDRILSQSEPDAAGGGITGNNTPQLGSPGVDSPPDPWHNATSFNGETNPEGILQWDDNRMNVPAAWGTSLGDRTVRVAVIDTGVDGSHKELSANYDNRNSANTIPCNTLTKLFGPGLGEKDCSMADTEGHGTWVASRIAGAVNGFASNGIAPNVQIVGYKTLSTTLGGGLTSWIVDGMLRACDIDSDLINMSLGGYNDLSPEGVDDTFLWVDAVNYCRSKGTAIIASAGNEHVRVNRATLTLTGSDGRVETLNGLGQVDSSDEGILSIIPPDTIANNDLRGLIETPAGIPGVIMVSSINNAIGEASADVPAAVRWPASMTGKRDQLAYYSSFGGRIDISAPGGARKFNIPRVDGGPGDILYGGWGSLGALTGNGEICQDPSLASPLTFSCFKVNGAAFGWLQGTSMSAPNTTGVAALVLAAHHELQDSPDALLARLQSTARTNMVNYMGPNDPDNLAPTFFGVPCDTGYCHVDFEHPLSFSDAYGAGLVNAAAAVS